MLLITSCTRPIEAVTDKGYNFFFILWSEIFEGGAQSPGTVSAVGTCMYYDGEAFSECYVVNEVWYHDTTHAGSEADPPSFV